MKPKRKTYIRAWKTILIFAIALLAGTVTYFFPFLSRPLEKNILDYHLRAADPGYNHRRIVVVMIRDKSVAQIGNWPWPTHMYANMLDGPLSGAKTVAFNIDFMSLGNAGGDGAFADAMQRHGNVVLGARYLTDEDKFIYPRKELRESAAGVGVFQTITENDGVYRQFQMYVEDKAGTLYPTYLYTILKQDGYGVQIDEFTHKMRINSADHEHLSEIQLDNNYTAWMANTDADQMEIYEYVDVMDGLVPPSVFDDAIVLIGTSNASERQMVLTPGGELYFSVRTANQLQTALSGFSVFKVTAGLLAVLVAIACLLCGFIALLLPQAFSFFVPIAFTAVSAFISHRLFISGILYLPVADIILWCWVIFLFIAFIQIRSVSNILNYTTIPFRQTFSFKLGGDEQGTACIIRHLQGLNGVFQSAGFQLIEPLIYESHAFVQKHKAELPVNNRDGAWVVIKNVSRQNPKHRVIVLHPKIDLTKPNEYTLLGVNKEASVYAVQSMFSLIRNASLYYKALRFGEEKQQMSLNLIKCMVAAIDAKDPITAGHSLRVAQMALLIGKQLNFTDLELEELELAALGHDIGKIGISDSVLHKRGIFSSEDLIEMKTHPIKGISIMGPSGLSKNITDAILNHHERPDGRGYPSGKSGDEIGIFAKIIKVVDVYDALMGERQYKKAWSPEKVCDLLYMGRGCEFDIKITDLFLSMVKPHGWQPPKSNEHKPQALNGTYKEYMQYCMGQMHFVKSLLHNMQEESGTCQEDAVNQSDINIFWGLEWGEPLWASHFLARRPCLLEYDAATENCHFALRIKGQLSGVVVFSFLRNFLVSGTIFITEPGWAPPETFNKPVRTKNKQFLWDLGKIFVMQAKTIEGFNSVVTFVTKYAFSNYKGLS